jgi:prevent-host-death family protein
MGSNTPTVTASDAKNRLGRLLDRVQAGEEVVITRHGEPVAKLIPIDKRCANDANLALVTFRRVRQSLAAAGVSASREEIRAWKNHGRR